MKPSYQFPKRGLILNVLFMFVILLSLTAGGNTKVAAKTALEEPAASPVVEKKSNQCFAANGSVSTNPLTGSIGFVGARPDEPIQQPVSGLQFALPEEAARGYLSECGTFFGLTDQASELIVMGQRQIDDRRKIIRFQQYFQGVPVIGGELLMQLTAANNILVVNGSILPKSKLNTKPDIDVAFAENAALELVADQYGLHLDDLKVSEGELWVYSPDLIGAKAGRDSLVWRMDVTPLELAPIRQLVLIDAHDGSVVLDVNQVDTARNRLTYTANNTTSRPGTLICNESNPTCTGGDTDAVNAHVFAGDTYDFYSSYHGRDSIDNAGMSLISTVHFDVGYCNAFWDGYQMTYGDGCTIVVDDVVAHEITHGVTEYESNLIYAGQPGAINESFSDIWGEFVDLVNGRGTDTAGVRWLMGEDTSIGAIRDMQDPPSFGDPDRMQSSLYVEGADVHINSGVGNKAAYLITDGDTFNGYTITGIGITKAAKIYYEAQTNILISSSKYLDLRNALNQACTNLIGTSGITSGDCTQVNYATLATEMDYVPAPPSNDDFYSPIVISGLPYTNSQNISGATTAVDDPDFACTGGQHTNTVWYQITPASSGVLTVDTNGSNFDTVLAVWVGGDPGSLTSVACNDDISYPSNTLSRIQVNVVAGQTYRIEAAGYFGGADLTLNASLSDPYVPNPIAPQGEIKDTTPTFKWSKVAGAQQYRFQLKKGAKTIYTVTVQARDCGSTTCTNTPSTVLKYVTYKWQVQALVGGVWRPYSPVATFSISGPFESKFTRNAAGWLPLNGTWTVANGNYEGSSIAYNLVSSRHIGNYSKLTYEARLKRTGLCTGCANVLYFRGIPAPLDADSFWDTGFYYAYTNFGDWSFWYAEDGVYYNLVPWSASSAIARNNWNMLKVAAKGTSIKLYINGKIVASGTVTGFNSSGNVGLGFYSTDDNTDKLYVDWASLDLSGLPFMFLEGKDAIKFNISRDSLVPVEGNPFMSP